MNGQGIFALANKINQDRVRLGDTIDSENEIETCFNVAVDLILDGAYNISSIVSYMIDHDIKFEKEGIELSAVDLLYAREWRDKNMVNKQKLHLLNHGYEVSVDVSTIGILMHDSDGTAFDVRVEDDYSFVVKMTAS